MCNPTIATVSLILLYSLCSRNPNFVLLLHPNREQKERNLLTANQHDTDGEDFLRIGVGRHISKSYTGQTAEGKIKCRDVFVFNGRSRTRVTVIVTFPNLLS